MESGFSAIVESTIDRSRSWMEPPDSQFPITSGTMGRQLWIRRSELKETTTFLGKVAAVSGIQTCSKHECTPHPVWQRLATSPPTPTAQNGPFSLSRFVSRYTCVGLVCNARPAWWLIITQWLGRESPFSAIDEQLENESLPVELSRIANRDDRKLSNTDGLPSANEMRRRQ